MGVSTATPCLDHAFCHSRTPTLTKRVAESLKTCESFCTLMTEMLKQNKNTNCLLAPAICCAWQVLRFRREAGACTGTSPGKLLTEAVTPRGEAAEFSSFSWWLGDTDEDVSAEVKANFWICFQRGPKEVFHELGSLGAKSQSKHGEGRRGLIMLAVNPKIKTQHPLVLNAPLS